jgi:tRNA modification GTPase
LPPEIEAEVAEGSRRLAEEIERHLADGHRGERLRDGIAVAIVGPPNAGKSSLLNQLARREAAITSPIAGTTRDVIEVAIDLAGYPVVLADTAGLRDSADVIEQEGLRRALRHAEEAELRLFVFDETRPEDATGAAVWPGPDTLLVANKMDLLGSVPLSEPRVPPPKPSSPGLARESMWMAGSSQVRTMQGGPHENPIPVTAIGVSALTGEGLPAVITGLAARISQIYDIGSPVLTRARHREALEAALAALRRSLSAGLPELRAEDLRLAWRSLGRITGRVDVEDLLDVIFRDFCLGK